MPRMEIANLDPLYEVYADGGVVIEEAGPNRRLIFCVRRHTGDGMIWVPRVALIVPAGLIKDLAGVCAADVLMSVEDCIGKPEGHG